MQLLALSENYSFKHKFIAISTHNTPYPTPFHYNVFIIDVRN